VVVWFGTGAAEPHLECARADAACAIGEASPPNETDTHRVAHLPTMRFSLLITLLSIPLLSACAGLFGARPIAPGELTPGDSYHVLHVGDRDRTFVLHVPRAYAKRRAPLPVLLVFHGSGGNGSWLRQQSELDRAADRHRFAVAYPDGLGMLGVAFLDWRTNDTSADARAEESANVAYVHALIEALGQVPGLDRTRIYAAGLSNGAILTYTLGCRLAGELAGIAIVAGEMADTSCAPARPLPMLAIHGTDDDVIPYDNHGRRSPGDVISYVSDPEAVRFWARRDGCERSPAETKHGHIIRDAYTHCSPGTAVVFYTVIGGKHEWPGGKRSWLFGHLPTRELNASNTILDFFARH
jgi:polyhydroxybutyrate depolymerase